MTLKPCVQCGEPSDRSRCPAHRPRDLRRHRGRGHTNDDPVMRRISRRLRKLAPFCELCNNVTNLTVDHIIPKSEAPELIYNPCNLRILCRDCNTRRGTDVTDEERNKVYQAIADRQKRLSARRAATRAVAPSTPLTPPGGKAKFELHTPGGYP